LPEGSFADADYVTPNESELRILLGLAPDDATPTPELAHRLRALGAKNLVVTMGERGAYVLTDATETRVASLPVEVVDTTGAGDAFNAGFAVALGRGEGLQAAVRFGCACGALACTRLGVVPSLPSRAAAEEAAGRMAPPR
jgi:ribokinase